MVNKVFLIGNVGTDPEVRSLESGVKVARFRLATTEKYATNNEKKEHTEWHTIILWRAQAEFAEKYIRKGATLYIEGKIRSHERIDENGTKRTNIEIHTDEIKIIRQPDPYKSYNTDSMSSITTEEPKNDDELAF